MSRTPLHHRRRCCRFCRTPIGSLQALAQRVREKPEELLTKGKQAVGVGQIWEPYSYAFGGLEEWVRHASAEIEGYCNAFCRGADQRAEPPAAVALAEGGRP